MKRVLWVSRHEMTPEQKADLERIMGGDVALSAVRDTVRDVESLRPALAKVDAAAVVLPPDMLQQLLPLAGKKPVLRAVSGRVPTGRTITLQDGRQESEFAFVHKCWEQILSVEIRTRRL